MSRFMFQLLVLNSLFCFNILSAEEKKTDELPAPKEMLEKLKTTELSEIKPEELARARELLDKRIKPANMDFNKKNIDSYLKTIPEEFQAGEKVRLEKIMDIKPLIIRILERNPYESNRGGGILLRSGKINGTIALANERVLIVKKSKAGKPKQYKWEELAFEQYENFLIYYAGQRIDKGGGGVANKNDSKIDAAEDYFRLSLLCDWFGKYEHALDYLKKALELNPNLKDVAKDVYFK